jgi:hypothetical protein
LTDPIPRENIGAIMRERIVLRVTKGSDSVTADNVRAAKSAIAAFFKSRGDLQLRLAADRWRFSLVKVDRDYDGIHYRTLVEPIDGTMRTDDRDRLYASYRKPSKTVDDVESDDAMVYRGMAWEEWQSIRSSCFVRSKGTLNVDQHNMTFFGRWGTAKEYASDYAPLPFRPTKNRPGVIIAIPRWLSVSHEEDPKHVPVGEWATRGSLSAAAIRGLWYVVPTYVRQGRFEVETDRSGKVRDAYVSGQNAQFAIVEGDASDVQHRCSGPRESLRNGSRKKRK